MGGLKLPNLNLPGGQKLTIGLDIGSHSVKACQMIPAGDGYKLISLGSASVPPDSVEDGVLQNPEAVGEVVGKLIQRLPVPSKTHYLGTGKLAELLSLKSTTNYNVVIFDDELSPLQQRNLEDVIQA